jgi:glycosyltransferase involved in cell wall biosynthesis
MFLVWAERHRGTRSAWLAESIGIDDLRYLAPTRGRGWWASWRKYPRQGVSTLRLLLARRPRVVFVQSPPSFAAWVATWYGVATRAAIVIDAHSDAFERSIWTRPRWATRLVARAAVATIVTNEHWAQLVRAWGGRAITVPSIPTDFAAGLYPPLAPGHNVAVVNTWASDEPLGALLGAATLLPGVTFHVTGRDDRVASLRQRIPGNVRFTGFLPEATYHGLLRAADAVVCLTTRDHTMQNGACEALSHETPIVTSDWDVLREYFDTGTVHVDNTQEGIARGIAHLLANLNDYESGVRELRARRQREWEVTRDRLIQLINGRLGRDGRRLPGHDTEEGE